jgi:hypothetical protein
MELRAAQRAERDAGLDLLAHWYNDRLFFARYNLNDPAFGDDLCLVAVDAGKLTPNTGHARVHLLAPTAGKAPAPGLLSHTAHDPELERRLRWTAQPSRIIAPRTRCGASSARSCSLNAWEHPSRRCRSGCSSWRVRRMPCSGLPTASDRRCNVRPAPAPLANPASADTSYGICG